MDDSRKRDEERLLLAVSSAFPTLLGERDAQLLPGRRFPATEAEQLGSQSNSK
jgi:hypothetical protein